MRKKISDYTQMQVTKRVRDRLTKLKIHPNQSYSEVIEQLLNNQVIKKKRVDDETAN